MKPPLLLILLGLLPVAAVGAGSAPPPSPASNESFAALEVFLTRYTRATYETVITALHPELPADQAAKVCELIATREVERARLTNYAALPAAERRDGLARADADFQARLTSVVGEQAAGQLAALDKAMANLKILNNVNTRLLYTAGALSADQYRRMFAAMNHWPSPEMRLDAAGPAMTDLIARRADGHAHILNEAAAFLEPAQLAMFADEFKTEIAYLNYVKIKRDELKANGGQPRGRAPAG